MGFQFGFGLTVAIADALTVVPKSAWSAAVDFDEQARDGAWVIDAAGIVDLSSWPEGMPLVIRNERPHPYSDMVKELEEPWWVRHDQDIGGLVESG